MPPSPAIQPYWRRFGSFFLYPLSLEPLLACLGIGVLAGLAGGVFFPANLVLQLVVLVATLRYGYKVLELTARGHLDEAPVLLHGGHGGKYLPYKQFVVIAIGLSLSAYAASIGGRHLAMVLLVLLGLLLPANAMLLALTNDLGESITPPRLWALIHRIGMPYLGLCACLLLLSSSSAVLLGWLVPVVPSAFVGALGGFLGAYFTVVMFRLMGYALYQYHDVLGVAVDVGFERQTAAAVSADPAAQRTAETATLIREGRFADAIALARSELAERPGDTTANLRLHRLLCAVPGEERTMLAHATEWLPALLRGGKERVAIDVVEAIWRHEPDYSPALGFFVLPLAQTFFDARRYDAAARLIKGFDRRFPGHADTPAVYLLGARLLIEHRRDETQARRVLAALREHYPESAAAAEAARLGELLDRLAAANAAGAG
ncbi:hypothetical protein LLG90_03805 [Aromatoleum toluclasticum]|uniref:tetratricopeptide repeat protein n=1 Tax=Aromatoleum toluclasticum TaxID=92003 RepID=UPI001D184E3A|nr:hypothetical protein [Aromatoleum toluclasticum]MCC4114473.1 hypothetical protein [Aromatoleum toluclasticum]